MNAHLVLDYDANRDGKPVFLPGKPPYAPKLRRLDDAKVPFRWAAGGVTEGQTDLPRGKGMDPRVTKRGRSVQFNADAAAILGADAFGFDHADKALLLNSIPLPSGIAARIGSPRGITHYSGSMHTGQHGLGYHRVRVVLRLPKGAGNWSAVWTDAQGDPDPEVSAGRDPVFEIDIEPMGHQPTKLWCARHSNVPRLDGSGQQMRSKAGRPYWEGSRSKDEVQGWVETGVDLTADFHEVGWDCTPDAVVWFLDGREVFRCPQTAAGRDRSEQGAHILRLDTVQSNENGWAGARGVNDPDCASLAIRSVRAWELAA